MTKKLPNILAAAAKPQVDAAKPSVDIELGLMLASILAIASI
jgi:hypothetical protein